jgi:peptidylglycine monooxygenase
MSRTPLYCTLLGHRWRIERPWGELPAGPGRVSDVAVDGEGRIFVLLRGDPYVDPEAPAVIVLDPSGKRIGAFGEEVADGHMLQTDAEGAVWVVDRDAHEVIRFSANGRRIGALGARHEAGAPFNSPCDIAFAPDGAIYVADGYGASRLHRFAAGGALLDSWGRPGRRGGEFTTPHAVWVNRFGEVAVCDRENHRVQVLDAGGRWLRDITDLHKPMDVVADAEGNWWVTDQVPRLSVFGRDGTLLARARAVLNGAHGLALHPDGSVLLAEMNPSRLTRLVPD